MSEFADIRLIECNRQQSVQGTSGNDTQPAQFTCRLGNTIDLKAGDTVEILNGFVSEDGCGSQNIELKGESIKDGFGKPITKDFEYTKLNIKYFNDKTDPPLQNRPLERMEIDVDSGKNTSITKEIKDNEITVEQSYYINNNGENYYTYPRKYLWFDRHLNPTATGTYLNNYLTDVYEGDDAPFLPTGATANEVFLSGINIGNPNKESLVATCDYHVYSFGRVLHDDNTVKSAGDTFYKPIVDNSRFTCFIRNKTRVLTTSTDFYKIMNDYAIKLNPILDDFTEYKELKTFSVPAGYSSPNAIAETITEQLQQTYEYDKDNDKTFTQPQIFKTWDGYGTNDYGGSYPSTTDPTTWQPNSYTDTAGNTIESNFLTDTLQTYQTETYKPFECWSPKKSHKDMWDVIEAEPAIYNPPFNDTQPALNLPPFELVQYMGWFNQAQFIYVKRPELFVKGRLINTYLGNLIDKDGVDENVFATLTNAIASDQTIGSTGTDKIRDYYQTNYEWKNHNLERFRDLFIEQKKYYKELVFDKLGDNKVNDVGKAVFSDTYDEARFLHLSRKDLDNASTSIYGRSNTQTGGGAQNPISGLGNDSYRGEGDAYLSTPIFFAYQSKNATKKTTGLEADDLCYGAMFKVYDTTSQKFYISFRNDLIKWLDFNMFDNVSPVPPATYKLVNENTRCIGWDWHSRSYGNVILGGYGGYLTQNTTGEYFYGKMNIQPYTTKDTPPPDIEPAYNSLMTQGNSVADVSILRYVGANNPSLIFDPVSQTFGWKSLHTAENTGQEDTAGSEHTKITQHPAIPPTESKAGVAGWTETQVTGVPINPQAETEVYKINKRFRYNCFCPDVKPYELDVSKTLLQPAQNKTTTIGQEVAWRQTDSFETKLSPPNVNLKVGAVFDSHCGIYFNFGDCCPEQYWHRSLIGILGFTYEQYNPTSTDETNNRQARVDNNNIFKIKLATTNSQVVSTDLKEYPMNIWGGITYSTQIPLPMIIPNTEPYLVGFVGSAPTEDLVQVNSYRPAIVQQTSSFILRSQGVPKFMSRPYYTIRTDLLDSSEYTGGLSGGLKLPIIGVVDKMSGEGDYYFTSSQGMAFTISRDRHISSITTSIHDPNGELARVDDSSAVIYKITRMDNTSKFNILEQILQEEVQSKKK
jgi:hypothetical protein